MMTKKKVLFLIGSLEGGGVSKSMINLLHSFDRSRYDVSLWIGKSGGIFFPLLPEDIRVLSSPVSDAIFSGFKGVKKLLFKGDFLRALGSMTRMAFSLINKGYAGWIMSRILPKITEDYDLIVDFNGQHQLYYMIDRLRGKKKVTFFHNDYAKWPYYYKVDKHYMKKADVIFTISQVCKESLVIFFSESKKKIRVMENISCPRLIFALAEHEAPEMKEGRISFVTIGHVCKRKGIELAIAAAVLLKKKKILFSWYFIGNVTDREKYSKMVKYFELEEYIHFTGAKLNPYPYIRRADIVIQASLFEGKSIALDEAKILAKPIVVTNFSTVHDQFEDGINASICDMTPESLAEAIEDLLLSSEKRMAYMTYLEGNIIDNSEEVDKLYELIDII